MSSPWLTIVTVVKDDAEGLQRTLESLVAQKLTDYQHVVIHQVIVMKYPRSW